MIQIDLNKYEINISAVLSLEKVQRKLIYQMIDDMMILHRETVHDSTSGISADFLFRSLLSEGYLISSRDRKISAIVSDSN